MKKKRIIKDLGEMKFVITFLTFVFLLFSLLTFVEAADLTVSSNTQLCGIQTYDNVVINSGANVTICPWNNDGLNGTLQFQVTNFNLSTGSWIFGNGSGFLGGNSLDGEGLEGPGGGCQGLGRFDTAGGGGYGGAGGYGSRNCGYGGVVYGNATNVTSKGSGGGWTTGWGNGGNGGGYLKINATNSINISGNITLNGDSAGADTGGGGGSGGGLWMITSNIRGTGGISADGGNGGTTSADDGGTGGGGRIFVQYSTNSSNIKMSVLDGQIGFYGPGAGGTITWDALSVASCLPVANTEWILNTTCTVTSTNITANKNLTIQGTGNLIMNGSTILNMSSQGAYIKIYSGGRLTLGGTAKYYMR